MSDKKFQLKDFFESSFMDTALEIYGLTEKVKYPDLQLVLQEYKNKLKKTPKFSRLWNFGQTYREKIEIDAQNFYVVSWSVTAAKKVIKKHAPHLSKFQLDEIIQLVNPNYINKSHLAVAYNNNSPIFVAAYPQAVNNKLVIIDGNHRVTVKHQHGLQEIPGYLLEPHQHLQAMVSETQRTLFKIHFNYYQLAAYIGGVISQKELEDTLYPL